MSKTAKPIWPRIPAQFVRAMLAGHSALGLAFAALIYLVCLTGSVAVLANELQRWEVPSVAPIERVSPEAIDALTRNVLARYEGVEHLYINLPDEDMPRFTVYVDQADTVEDPELTANADGQILAGSDTPFTHFLTRLHINLHLPHSWGIFIVGLTGVALLSSLVSGLFAHPRAFRDAFYLRWGGSKRLQEADLHNRIGIWGLPFHIIISLTGALIGLTTIIVGFLALALFQGDMDRAYALFLPPAPIDDPAPAAIPTLGPMFSEVIRIAPDANVVQVIFEHPGETGQSITLYATMPQQLSFGDSFTFNGQGELIHNQVLAESSAGINILQAVSVLHFGWFGGWPIKIAYVLLGIGLTAVTSSGVAIWLARRRAKRRPAPLSERIWIGFVWSQPVAFAAAGVAAFTAPAIPLLALWGVLTVTLSFGALALSATLTSFALRALTALLLIAAAVAHGLATRGTVADPMAWIIDGVLLVTSLILFATLAVRPAASESKPPSLQQPSDALQV